MEQIINEIMKFFDNGVGPSVLAVLSSAGALGLAVAKNKLVKMLSNRTKEVDTLQTKLNESQTEVQALKAEVIELKEIMVNTNKIVSASIDMVHTAYLNSKLDVNSKINLQKLYDKCPDAVCDEPNTFINTVNEAATEEQIKVVEEAAPASYADIIENKIAQEV